MVAIIFSVDVSSEYIGAIFVPNVPYLIVSDNLWRSEQYTVWCRFNEVNLLLNPHKIHPLAGALGRGMGFI